MILRKFILNDTGEIWLLRDRWSDHPLISFSSAVILRKGFARVCCPDCHEEFFVAFSCRQRSCCPTCDQKRALLLGHRLKDEALHWAYRSVFADVPHRQWVFTIPKRFRCEPKLDYGFFEQTCLELLLHVNRALKRSGSGMHYFAYLTLFLPTI